MIDLNSHKNNIRNRITPAAASTENDDKKKVKCRHYPNCNLSDEECPFIHPKEDCPFFPKC